MANIDYRDATLQDEDALVELWWTMQASHHEYDAKWYADKGEEACKASWREHFRSLIQDANAVIVVATSAGVPIGMIVAHFGNRPPIYTVRHSAGISTGVVHPGFRRHGVFRGMLALLEEKARAVGIKVMHLSVHKDNPAKEAYEKTGFATNTQGMMKWLE